MDIELLMPGFCADTLKIHRATLLGMVKRGMLPAVLLSAGKTRHVYRIPRSEFEKFLRERMTVIPAATATRGRKRG